jgi:RimJ/RimL family protein N-acetyltransferase
MLYCDTNKVFSVRPAIEKDIPMIVGYFIDADEQFLSNMGAAKQKLPQREEWIDMLVHDFKKQPNEKQFFYIIWLNKGDSVGHCNINKIVFSKEAYMHLHVWSNKHRRIGLGETCVKLSLPFFFEIFKLQNLFCEPYALNTAPNKTLAKVGFEFEKKYETIPGWINFHQPVNRWFISYKKFKMIYGD